MIELLINGQPIALSDDFEISINKTIADIRNPETRSSDFTRTLTIPGTSENNKVFNFIFDVANDIVGSGQYNPDFDPNKKADCIVLVDGMPQISGFIRLTEILNNNGRIEYQCTIHGEGANLFTDLENAKLNELDFSEYNHTCNIINIKDSWDNQIYVDGSPQSFEYGNGYVWTQVLPKRTILNADVNEWKADDHTPALYAKTIVDKIFSTKGYKYTDDSFFTSDRFKRLIVPYSNDALNASGATDRLFQAETTGTTFTSGTTDFTIPFGNDSSGGNFDNGNNYDNTSYEYTVPVGGQYTFYFAANATFTITTPLVSPVRTTWEIELFVNGVSQSLIYLGSDNVSDNSWTFTNIEHFTRQFDANDVIKIVGQVVSYVDSGFNVNLSYGTLSISSGTYFYNGVSNTGIKYNETVDFGFFFNDKHTQKEFMLSLVRMFNLYVEQTNPKELRFVTRDEFYDGANIDWTKLLDYDQPHEIVPMGDLQNNPYVFTYKQGTDYKSKEYQESTGRIYGDRTLRIDNDFVKSEKKIEVVFSSTTLYNENNKFFSLSSDDKGKHTTDLRILYYNGLKQVPTYFFYDETKPSQPNVEYYPVTTHMDNPYDMQFDLSFGMPQAAVVPLGFQYSNQNLVNVYYYKTIAEIIDKNSKIFRGYFRINPQTFANIRFNSLYFFEGQYWRLNKVIDFNPTQEGLTKCEFLLAGYYPPSKPNTKPIGVGGSDTDNPVNPDFYTLDGEPQVKNTKNTSGGVDSGDNFGSSDDTVMMGTGNTNYGKYNTILAGEGVFIGQFDNTTTIHCNDFEVPQGDRVYVENYPVVGAWLGSGKVVNITDADSPYSATYDDWLILCDTSGGSITVTLPQPSAANKGKMYVVKKTESANQVTLLSLSVLSPVGAIKVEETLCPKTLEAKWMQTQIAPGSPEAVPFEEQIGSEKASRIAKLLEVAMWQGDTATSNTNPNTNRFDGFNKIIDAASASTVAGNTSSATAITVANVEGLVDDIYNVIPADIADAEDLVLFVGIDTFKKYSTALRNSNLFHYAADSEGMEIMIPATNVKMIGVGGLSGTNRMFLARLSNLFVGTDLANEEEEYRFWYSQDNDEVRFRATMKYGVQIAFPDQLVQFKLA